MIWITKILSLLKQESEVVNRLSAIIADVVHVSEYIWKAANAILGEKSEKRTSWVRARMKDLLEGRMDLALTLLTTERGKGDKMQSQVAKLNTTITYLTNHRHKMDYQTYLKKGYPISTGLVEGCCGHLVKDRMEHSGMRWTKKGAQNMMGLRAVNKNEDWNDFMQFAQDYKAPKRLIIRA